MSEALNAEAPQDVTEALAIPEVVDTKPETQDDAGGAPEPDTIAKAEDMGWTPKDQFKGDPSKWLPAAEFVRRGEEFVPFLKATNKKLDAKVHKLESTVAKLAEHNAKTDERAYERALRDLKAELATAAQSGDAEAVDQITDEIADLKTAKAAPRDTFEDTFNAWKADNAWYDNDPDLQAYAFGVGQELAGKKVSREDQLTQVAERVRKAFPHKFENPRRREPGAVEGATNARRPAGKTYADMPADARQICDEFVRDKILTREKYVADYFK